MLITAWGILLYRKHYPRPVLKLRPLQLYVPLHEDTSGNVLRITVCPRRLFTFHDFTGKNRLHGIQAGAIIGDSKFVRRPP